MPGWVHWAAFLSIARFVHFVMVLLFLSTLMILPFPLSFVRLSLSTFSYSFFYSIPSTFGILMDEQKLWPPSFAVSNHGLFDRCLGSPVNNGSVCALSANLNYRLHPPTQYLQFPPQCRRPCQSRVLRS